MWVLSLPHGSACVFLITQVRCLLLCSCLKSESMILPFLLFRLRFTLIVWVFFDSLNVVRFLFYFIFDYCCENAFGVSIGNAPNLYIALGKALFFLL